MKAARPIHRMQGTRPLDLIPTQGHTRAMDPTEPAIDLILSRCSEQSRCTICERRWTLIRCDSCEPAHALCRDCIGPHRADFNAVEG